MKYLVLGSSGQIGSHLVQYLIERGHQVLTFDIIESEEEDLRLHQNPSLKKKMEECDFVYFLAFDVGGSRYLKKYQSTYEFISNNTKIMDTTFSCLKETGKPFLFASSQMSNMDYSSYGSQKRIGEHYTRSLNGISVKLWNVYGIEKDENKSHVITDFIKKARSGVIDMITDGSECRQFLYAEDCCECLYILSTKYTELDRDSKYHISNFEWTSVLDVARKVQEVIPCEIRPAKEKDSIQMGERNEPDPYILQFWTPKTTISEGIKKIILTEIVLNSFSKV